MLRWLAPVMLLAACMAPDPPAVPSMSLPEVERRILVLGDWGSGTESQREVSRMMEQVAAQGSVDAILTTGDNFYSDDETRLMAPFHWAVEEEIPFWVTWGNHDVESEERVADINSVFGNPPRWVVHEWGEIDVMIMDSTQVGDPAQTDFLQRYLAGATRPAIVVFHHPAWSCGEHGPTESIVEAWLPHFDSDVFLALSGHDHNYQRIESEGITFVVTGGGGRRLYDVVDCPVGHPDLVTGEKAHHFLVLDLGGGELRLSAIRSDGTLLDQVTIELGG